MSSNISISYKFRHIAAPLLFLESLLLLALGIYMIALGFTHDKAWMPYLSVIGFSLAGSIGLYVVSKGLKERKRWAYSPAILSNLISLGVAKYQYEAKLYWSAVPITLLSFLVVVSILINFSRDGQK